VLVPDQALRQGLLHRRCITRSLASFPSVFHPLTPLGFGAENLMGPKRSAKSRPSGAFPAAHRHPLTRAFQAGVSIAQAGSLEWRVPAKSGIGQASALEFSVRAMRLRRDFEAQNAGAAGLEEIAGNSFGRCPTLFRADHGEHGQGQQRPRCGDQ
jgi:hypothetical protein